MLELLKDKVYIRYWLAVFISFVGDAVTLTTVVYLVGSQTENAMLISLVLLAPLLPIIFLGPMIGPFVDRWNRRKLLVAADIYRFFIVLLMIPCKDSVAALAILLFLLGIGTAFFEPARIASVPVLVGQHRIPQGIALFQSTSAVIKFTGPVLAGLLIQFFNAQLVFILDAFSYTASAILLSSIGILSSKASIGGNGQIRIWSDALNGIKQIVRLKEIRALLVMLLPVMFVSGIVMTNYKGVMLVDFHMSAIKFGWVEAFFAVGFVAGALQGPKLLRRYAPNRLLRYSILVVAFCSAVMFLLPHMTYLYPVLIWSSFLGFGESLMQVPVSNLILQKIPDELRGRGVAVSNSFMSGSYVIGIVSGGIVAANAGALTTFVFAAVLFLVIYAVVTVQHQRSARQEKQSA